MRCQHCDTLEKQFHALSKHSDALEKQLHALTTLRHIGKAITCTVNTATHWRSNYTRSQNTATQHCDTPCDSPARPKATCCANYIFTPKRPACQSHKTPTKCSTTQVTHKTRSEGKASDRLRIHNSKVPATSKLSSRKCTVVRRNRRSHVSLSRWRLHVSLPW